MRKLFEVGLNDGGFFVFPVNRPPKKSEPTGYEVDLEEASDLSDSLNQCVENYIVQTARDEPRKLLRALAQHWDWRAILEFIGDLIWYEYLDMVGAIPQGTFYKNSLALNRLLARWL